MTPQLGTILSIEDNDTDFMTLEFALRSAGVKNPVQRWDNGSTAMQILIGSKAEFEGLKASLVLLDLNLPGVDGLQLLKALRARDPNRRIPVLVLSTSSHPRDIDACYLAGADGYLVKPLDLESWEADVGNLAEKWLADHRQNSAEREQAVTPSANLKKCEPTASMRKKFERDMRRSQLTRTIECEIIPRLLIAHGCVSSISAIHNLPAGTVESGDEVAELVHLVLARDARVAASYIETRRLQGATLENLFHVLIGPAARLIGDLWKAEICSFHEFSEGLSRLQLMLVELGPNADKTRLH
ncbi:response regulator [Hyphomicrobium sp.]|jgi:CheY-like chemotaxis protein|uniref:response regulator n=1 Tax=Hyphomicrobium sp. TaxID=82 RepID=UPI003568A46F